MRCVPLFFALFISLVSCDSTTNKSFSVELSEQPEFIDGASFLIDESNSEPTRVLCIALDEEFLWENGNTASDLTSNLLNTSQLSIDQMVINLHQSTNSQLTINSVIDEDGNILGSYGDIILCYDLVDFQPEAYVGQFSVKSLSGVEYHATLNLDL